MFKSKNISNLKNEDGAEIPLKNPWKAKFRVLLIGLAIIVILMVIGIMMLVVAAVKLRNTMVNVSPSYNSQDLYAKANDQIDKGDYAEAEKYLEQALLKEDDQTYRNKLAVVKYRLKKYSESVDQYQKLIDKGSDVGFAWNGMGNAYRDWADSTKRKDLADKAEAAYRNAIKADPSFVAAYSNLAILLNSQGRVSEAKTILDQGIARTDREELKLTRERLGSQ